MMHSRSSGLTLLAGLATGPDGFRVTPGMRSGRPAVLGPVPSHQGRADSGVRVLPVVFQDTDALTSSGPAARFMRPAGVSGAPMTA
jgi:hypothetical protein